MPDRPTETELFELLDVVALMTLDAVEKEDPPDERADIAGRRHFELGFRCGFLLTLDSLAYRPAGFSEVDPAWTEEQLGAWLVRRAVAALDDRKQISVEWNLRRLLRDEEGNDEG